MEVNKPQMMLASQLGTTDTSHTLQFNNTSMYITSLAWMKIQYYKNAT
jgi:hypothetical protein